MVTGVCDALSTFRANRVLAPILLNLMKVLGPNELAQFDATSDVPYTRFIICTGSENVQYLLAINPELACLVPFANSTYVDWTPYLGTVRLIRRLSVGDFN